MSRQRAKGTRWESLLLPQLRRIWPKAARAGTTLGMNDQGDYLNTGDWLIEAKNRKTLTVPAWVHTLEGKAGGRPWLIAARTDARSMPDLAILPLGHLLTLLDAVKEKLGGPR